MDYNELLIDFADGNLPIEDEENLFMHLSTNEELRIKLKQIMSIDKAIKNNSNYFTPPVDSTLKIFSELGFQTPKAVVNDNIFSTIGSGTSSFFSKYYQSIASGLFSAVLTAIIFMLFIMPSKETNYQNDSNLANRITNSKNNTNESIFNSIPRVVSKDNSFRNNSQNINHKKYISNFDSNIDSIINGEEQLPKLTDNENIDQTITMLDYNYIDEHEATFNSNIICSPEPLHSTMNYQASTFTNTYFNKLSIEVGNSQNWSIPKETITPSEYAKFNNTNIGIYYKFNDDIALGFNLRQENYYMKFNGLNAESKKITIEEQPNFTSYSLAMKYYFANIDDIKMFGQTDLGFNKVGMVNRLSVNGEYSPYSSITFHLGLEYDMMNYHYQNNLFNSQKLGMYYGLSYNF